MIEEEKKEKIEERLDQIEKELRQMQKQWIDMYETVIRLIHDKPNTNNDMENYDPTKKFLV